VATGIVLATAGLVAYRHARGPLLLVTAAAWLAGDVSSQLLALHRGPLVHALLGRNPVTIAAYVDGAIAPLARSPLPTLALVVAVVAVAALRRRPIPLAGAVAVGGALALEAAGRIAGADTAAAAAWCYDGAVVATAIALARRERPAGAAATGLVIDLGAEPQAVRAAIARAVGDPTLDVAYRVAGAWVDEAGRPLALPATGSRVVTPIDDVAALIHDPAALRDGALARSVAAALRLVLANVRLRADVAARVREVERSRRRLVEAGDAERRRMREQIRTGAERQLVAAGVQLSALPGSGALRAELDRAQADLVRFAQGVHPRALTEHGLGVAVRELATESRAGVRVDIAGRRFGSALEAVAYFVCSEALANVAKYAAESDVRVAVTAPAGRLRVCVEDDGPGGADPTRGSGLRGIADRVEALGGGVFVDSPAGAGTRVVAELPVAA
jgi:signal transduction histidine kinase